MQTDEAPSPILFQGRDRSPSGPCLPTWFSDGYFSQPVASRENPTKELVFREQSFLSRLYSVEFLSEGEREYESNKLINTTRRHFTSDGW